MTNTTVHTELLVWIVNLGEKNAKRKNKKNDKTKRSQRLDGRWHFVFVWARREKTVSIDKVGACIARPYQNKGRPMVAPTLLEMLREEFLFVLFGTYV